MTRYRISKAATAAAIEILGTGDNQERLLEAFQDCAEGRCSCPTVEYGKVASMQIASDDDRIDIRLEARPGVDLDTSQIAHCLDHTLAESDRG